MMTTKICFTLLLFLLIQELFLKRILVTTQISNFQAAVVIARTMSLIKNHLQRKGFIL